MTRPGCHPERSSFTATIRPDEWVDFGVRRPYDYLGYANAGLQEPGRTATRDAVLGIIACLGDRSGFGMALDRIDLVLELGRIIDAAARLSDAAAAATVEGDEGERP